MKWVRLVNCTFHDHAQVSPDGKKLAIVANELQSNVYICDITTGMRTKLTKEGNNFVPVWMSDDKKSCSVVAERQKGDGVFSWHQPMVEAMLNYFIPTSI